MARKPMKDNKGTTLGSTDRDVGVALARVVEAMNRQDFQYAGQTLAALLRDFPRHPDVLHLSGYLKLIFGEEEEGIRLIRKAIRRAPKVALYHYNLGNALFKRKDLEGARKAFQAAVRFDPHSQDALTNLAIVTRELKRLREAVQLFEQAVEIAPGDAAAWLNLAKAHMELREAEKVDEAVEKARCLQGAVVNAAFLGEVGRIYYGLGKHPVAEACFREALSQAPDDPILLFSLGKVLAEQEHYEEARANFEKARKAGALPHKVDAAIAEVHIVSGEVKRGREALLRAAEAGREDTALLLEVAQALSLIGDFDIQERLLLEILEANPHHVGAQLQLAFVPKRALDRAGVEFMEKHIDDPGIDAGLRTSMGFALGNHYRNIKDYDKAFHYYAKGNRLKGYRWDRAEYRAWVDETIGIYNRAFFEQRSAWGLNERLPILIVGMPRSGTTLAEQILSSHSRVSGAGEVGTVSGLSEGQGVRVPRILTDASSILNVDENALARMAENHLGRLRAQIRGDEDRVTNKLPHNFQQVGLFALEFPKAPIIHIRRDPRDNLLSIYFQDFGGYHPYAYDLKNLAFQYWQQERLMRHWKSVIPNPVFTLDYEALVGDLEGMIRCLADFLGLEVEEAMKKFYKQERQVQTASKWQVRQKLYTTSVARWKPYEKHLGPLFDALREYKPEDIPDEYGLFDT